VRKYAEAAGIELLFLPSYSPNLNLIERLWKFVKKTCFYSKYYTEFKAFKEAECLENKTAAGINALESLLTCNFQRFEKVKISTV
jgi:transposase